MVGRHRLQLRPLHAVFATVEQHGGGGCGLVRQGVADRVQHGDDGPFAVDAVDFDLAACGVAANGKAVESVQRMCQRGGVPLVGEVNFHGLAHASPRPSSEVEPLAVLGM